MYFQLKDLQVFTVVRTIVQLSEEIPCISAVVVALLAEACNSLWIPGIFTKWHHHIMISDVFLWWPLYCFSRSRKYSTPSRLWEGALLLFLGFLI